MKVRGALIIAVLGTLSVLRSAEPTIEFSGVMTADGTTKLALTNKATGATTWVAPGENYLGYTVARYEAKDDAVFLRKNGKDIRLSLTFYRTEYDRESLPRYAFGGWTDLPQVSRWIADRLGIGAPLELMDPFKAVEVRGTPGAPEMRAQGPQFLQAFGLALRGL